MLPVEVTFRTVALPFSSHGKQLGKAVCMNNPNILPSIASGVLAGRATVSARDLHAFLGVGRDFSTWIKGRIEKYGFQPDHDFVIDAAPPVRGAGNRGASVEYHISINMAKEPCLVE